MSLGLVAPEGSTRVIAIGHDESMVRGRPSEFRHRGISLTTRSTGLDGLLEISRDRDCIVLASTDLTDMPFLAFCEIVHSLANVPVIAGAGSVSDGTLAVALAEHGVSRVVPLPVTPARLADVVASMRPAQRAEHPFLRVGRMSIDSAQHAVIWCGEEVRLAPKEFEVLRYMVSVHPRLVTVEELGQEFESAPGDWANRVRVSVARVRNKLEAAAPSHEPPIETVHRLGYRLHLN